MGTDGKERQGIMIDWSQVTVKHLRYGEGTVLACENGFIHVVFPEQGEKSFIYPESFGRFLKCEDPAVMTLVTTDLIMKKAEEDAVIREKQALEAALAKQREESEAASAPRPRRRSAK